jgi:hypothetical protein
VADSVGAEAKNSLRRRCLILRLDRTNPDEVRRNLSKKACCHPKALSDRFPQSLRGNAAKKRFSITGTQARCSAPYPNPGKSRFRKVAQGPPRIASGPNADFWITLVSRKWIWIGADLGEKPNGRSSGVPTKNWEQIEEQTGNGIPRNRGK